MLDTRYEKIPPVLMIDQMLKTLEIKTGINKNILRSILDCYWEHVFEELVKNKIVYTKIGRIDMKCRKVRYGSTGVYIKLQLKRDYKAKLKQILLTQGQ